MTTTNAQYVFSPWLTPVRVVSTSNIAGTYYNGPNNNGVGATYTIAASSLTIDSVNVVVGDRVLLQTQTSTYTQGIYVVESIGSTVVLQRSEDQQSLEQIQTGQYVSVKGGSVNAGSFFTVIEPRPNNIGVDAIVFSADPASGAAVTFSGGPSVANSPAIFSNTAGDIKPQTTTATFGFGITAATGNIVATAGSLQSGSSSGGFVGLIEAFPTTASSGSIALQGAVNGSGNFGTTLSNQTTQAQAQVLTFPDVGAATGNVLAAGAALVSGNLVQASGTSGAVVDSGIVAANIAKVATVSLTSANITGMYATPVQILAAPGAGKINIIDSIQWDYAFLTAAYTAGGLITAQYGTTNHAGGTIVTTGIPAATFNGLSASGQLNDVATPFGAANTVVENAAIYMSNATQAFASGSGTVTLYIRYRTVTPA